MPETFTGAAMTGLLEAEPALPEEEDDGVEAAEPPTETAFPVTVIGAEIADFAAGAAEGAGVALDFPATEIALPVTVTGTETTEFCAGVDADAGVELDFPATEIALPETVTGTETRVLPALAGGTETAALISDPSTLMVLPATVTGTEATCDVTVETMPDRPLGGVMGASADAIPAPTA